LATSQRAGLVLDRLEEASADALSAKRRQDGEIAKLDQRSSGKRRDSAEAGRDADRLGSVIGEEDDDGRLRPQAGNERRAYALRQRMGTAHRIRRVGISEIEH